MIGKEVSVSVNKKRLGIAKKLAILPGAFHLRHFLFERHSGEQVGYPLLDRQFRVAVEKGVLRESGNGRAEKQNQTAHHIQTDGRDSA